jgi:hypothetical protein
MKQSDMKVWALVDTTKNEVLFTVPTRDDARLELRDAKQLWGNGFKIAKLTFDSFAR